MIRIALGFVPWILYSILIPMMSAQSAVLISLASAIVLNYKELKKGFILIWGTSLYFLCLWGFIVFFHPAKDTMHANLWANSALALIIWASLVLGKPFTLQYAREQTEKDFWELPSFFRSNQIITAVWGIAISLSASVSGLHILGFMHTTTYTILLYVPYAFAIWFTKWYPKWFKQKKINQWIAKAEKSTLSTPFLQGNFAPVSQEIDATDLPIEGELPKDLIGIYMRNGPNPAYPPFSFTYPFDGDGMLHAIYIRNGKASYRNRFIKTDQLRVEKRVGKALYGGIECPFIRDEKLLLPNEPTMPVKLGRFIHIIRHANRLIAFHEANSAYEVDAELSTIGEWNPTKAKSAIEVNPHPRLDPETGELYLISYHFNKPVITYHVLNKEGVLIYSGEIAVQHSYMIHDFVLTKNYIILFLCPVLTDRLGGAKGKHMFNWQGDLNTQIILVARGNPSNQIRMETEPFFTFHFANAYEMGNQIHVDYVRYPKFSTSLENIDLSHLYRTTIDLTQKRCTHQQMDDRSVEFPRINDRQNSSQYRYVYIPTNLHAKQQSETFHALVKYDLQKNTTAVHDFGLQYEIGEAVYVAKAKSDSEDDGYLMLFATDRSCLETDFFLLDAKDIARKPLARVRLPQRVPHGLHGSWMPGPW